MKLMRMGLACALTLGLSATGNAATIPSTTTYTFSGKCTDCSGTAGAELILSNYTLGDDIGSNNFVSFHYDGTNRFSDYLVTAGQNPSVSGKITGPLPDAETFSLTLGFGEFAVLYFNSYKSDGGWSTGIDEEEFDYGSNHTWGSTAAVSTVPEPMSATLVGMGLIGLSFRRWRASLTG